MLQDDIALVEGRLHLVLGSKFEHNDYTGFEYQPSGRLAWTPSQTQTIWFAASRAVRSPSRIDRELFSPSQPPFILAGGPDFQAETVHAYEGGYKVQPAETFAVSAATFYNDYAKLRSLEGSSPSTVANGLDGKSHGVEIDASYQPGAWWRLHAGYAYFHLSLGRRPGSTDSTQERQEGDSPRNVAFLESRLDLPRRVEFDAALRYVGSLPNQAIPQYLAFDARLGWHVSETLEISLAGTNLLDASHAEFGPPATRNEIQRSVYAKVVCRF